MLLPVISMVCGSEENVGSERFDNEVGQREGWLIDLEQRREVV